MNKDFERPVLIVRKFNKELFWAVPLTSKVKEGGYYFTMRLFGNDRSLMLSQLRILSSRRLLRKMHRISFNKLSNIHDKLSLVLKTAPPIRAKPRMPNGSLYVNYSKSVDKNQLKLNKKEK